MKKIIGSVFISFILLFVTNQRVSANENLISKDYVVIKSEKEFYEDGSYIIYKILEYKNATSLLTTSYFKTGTKNVRKYDSNNKLQWIYTLSAQYFIEEGISVVCTKANYSNAISNSNWKFSDGSTNYSGNTAYGKGKFTYRIWFITTKTEIIDIHISCDNYGNLS